jgi:hypothetical protein
MGSEQDTQGRAGAQDSEGGFSLDLARHSKPFSHAEG